ncbi:GNAT family N-acetyltransferase [Propionibacteriaceae bacterium Y1700]|uniref:GNAT family N-acetyltransferase n=1 Tax=Microlunatus sp. Y1700 TaxID=3418487 RepID=UPI003DA6E58A
MTGAVAAEPNLPLITDRLRLRHYRDDDVDAMLSYYADPTVARYLLDEPWDRAKAEQEVARRTGKRHITAEGFGISLVVEHDDAVIGDIVLWAADATLSLGEIGWVYHPDAGGKGLATEAAQAVLDLAFGHYRMHRVKAQLDARNAASARMCERLGMTHEAHLRRDWFSKGEWTDTIVYGLLATERTSAP